MLSRAVEVFNKYKISTYILPLGAISPRWRPSTVCRVPDRTATTTKNWWETITRGCCCSNIWNQRSGKQYSGTGNWGRRRYSRSRRERWRLGWTRGFKTRGKDARWNQKKNFGEREKVSIPLNFNYLLLKLWATQIGRVINIRRTKLKTIESLIETIF